MSKLAKIPVILTEGVSFSLDNHIAKISGPKGNLSFAIPEGIDVKSSEGRLLFTLKNQDAENKKPLLGLTRANIANMVIGVSKGFEKKLELSGVGYRASVSGNEISLSIGFSHPVKVVAPQGIVFSVAENTIIVSGIDKDLVGNTAARIRAIRPPEPYKGKGIKYFGEKIRRKAGKVAKTLGVK